MSEAPTCRLHRKLYRRSAVDAAIQAYGELCTPTLRIDGEHYEIVLTDPDPELAPILASEFANYALAETIEGRR